MTQDEPRSIILWFRKDLRLDDNHALNAAAESNQPIIPVFIYQPDADKGGPLGEAQKWWLHHSLQSLSDSLDQKGGKLLLASGDVQDILRELTQATNAQAIYWNRCHDPVSAEIDEQVEQICDKAGLKTEIFPGQLLHDPDRIRTGGGSGFRVYTPFWRALEKEPEPEEPLSASRKLLFAAHKVKSERLDDWNLLPKKPNWASHFSELWEPGEAGAKKRLHSFIKNHISGYAKNRDIPAVDGTSRLSPHLAHGEISPRQIWHATRGLGHQVGREDVRRFRQELVWREFSYHLLHYFPKLASANWNERFDRFAWRGDNAQFRAWARGLTGYPIVDAGMRQLWKHGYVHNRVRMIVGSFLIKDLMIDWRKGEEWFRDTLLDADPANNAASWQWVAGSGADASPFFRIFNPITQGEKFDPNGDYIRRYVPELAKLDTAYIHKPFAAPASVLENASVVLGKTYPKPIVDHATARNRALDAYKAVKSSDD
ncbi:cryptochrome/photolyase family protein [Oryzifoliimicrobium ureilyticus]|uniref:cryptochrome/photolyase family protein n=1 Tax=Oryzifoliimicrobium ureilyticus TaxID=3113724 RepID=UPI0030766E87